MTEAEKVTADQASEALQQLLGTEESEATTPTEPISAEQPAEEEAATAAETPAADEVEVEQEPAPEAAEDDLESLRQRLKSSEETHEEQLKAISERYSSNERILRDRYLKKADALQKALKTLEEVRTGEGASESDVDRVINELRSTMHPDSASYVEPQPAPAAASQDQALVMNSFLIEKRMTAKEAEDFGDWIKTEAGRVMSPTEQAVANESLGGFLQLAHLRWQQSQTKDTRADAVAAVRAVQRTQRQAAKAAAPTTPAPKKTTVSAPAKDEVAELLKLPKAQQNDAVAALLKASVDQYRGG